MAAAIISLLSGVTTQIGAPPITSAPGSSGPYRPPQWGRANKPPFTLTYTDAQGTPTVYVFDVIIHAEHQRACEITHNPVQTGAATSDHAYIRPARLSIEIRMSDAMQSYVVDQFTSNPSKSVSAYQKLLEFQESLSPVAISTRIADYSNMMITNIMVDDSQETAYGLKAYVTFEQLITATIQVGSQDDGGFPTSAIQQMTDETPKSQIQLNPVPASIEQQNNIANASADGVDLTHVPTVAGAGNWSSYNVGGLGKVIGAVP